MGLWAWSKRSRAFLHPFPWEVITETLLGTVLGTGDANGFKTGMGPACQDLQA